MITALQLLDPPNLSAGFTEVTESALETMDAKEAHQAHFICGHEGCGIRLFAVMPTHHPEGGKPIRAHFRTRKKETHIGHGVASIVAGDGEGLAGALAQGSPPQGWRDPPAETSGTPSSGASVNTIPPSSEGSRPEGRKRGDGVREGGPARTSSLPSLVAHWKGGQPHIRSVSFKMRHSGASTWGELFVDVADTLAPGLVDTGQRRVLHGRVKQIERYGPFAFKLVFAGRVGGKFTSCYLKFDDDAKTRHIHLYECLIAASTSFHGCAYILGLLTRWGGSISIQQDALGHVLLDPDEAAVEPV